MEAKLPPALACCSLHPTQCLHYKQLVGGEMWLTSACGQIVCKLLFFQGDERISIDWEDRLPSYCQKSQVDICCEKILENIFFFFTSSCLIIDPVLPQDFAAGCHSYERQWKNTAEW